MSLGHQPDEKVLLPHIDISIDGTSKSEVVLQTKEHLGSQEHTDRFFLRH